MQVTGMSDSASVQISVHGLVQGVFFRDFTSRRARELGLTGYVRNLPGGSTVEIIADGEVNELKELIGYLKTGPASAKVERVDIVWSDSTGNYTDFSIKY
jgi:acylphosphatase